MQLQFDNKALKRVSNVGSFKKQTRQTTLRRFSTNEFFFREAIFFLLPSIFQLQPFGTN